MKLKATLLVAASLAASVLCAPASAATFVLDASTHDRFNGEAIRYHAILQTGDATTTAQGLRYDILGASGTAHYDAFTAAIQSVMGGFTLNNGSVAAIDASFQLDDPFGGGLIDKGTYDMISLGEVGGAIETLTITPQSAVPEPASWGLLLFGFGGAGAAIRRRALVRKGPAKAA